MQARADRISGDAQNLAFMVILPPVVQIPAERKKVFAKIEHGSLAASRW